MKILYQYVFNCLIRNFTPYVLDWVILHNFDSSRNDCIGWVLITVLAINLVVNCLKLDTYWYISSYFSPLTVETKKKKRNKDTYISIFLVVILSWPNSFKSQSDTCWELIGSILFCWRQWREGRAWFSLKNSVSRRCILKAMPGSYVIKMIDQKQGDTVH